MKKNVLIIGAGGVAQVVAHKCAQNNDVLGDIHIASRTKAKCDAIIESIMEKKALKQEGVLQAHQLDALDIPATVGLIKETGVEMAGPFLDGAIRVVCARENRVGGRRRREDRQRHGATPPAELHQIRRGCGLRILHRAA